MKNEINENESSEKTQSSNYGQIEQPACITTFVRAQTLKRERDLESNEQADRSI